LIRDGLGDRLWIPGAAAPVLPDHGFRELHRSSAQPAPSRGPSGRPGYGTGERQVPGRPHVAAQPARMLV
jgi:hypothetical protein